MRPYRSTAAMLVSAALLAAVGWPPATHAAPGPQEGSSMSSLAKTKPLLWQAAAGRKPVRFVPIAVTSVTPETGGSFGIGQSPSMAGAYPDARNVQGRALNETVHIVTVRAPATALPHGLAEGQRLVLGLVDDGHVICLLAPPANVAVDSLADWAKEQPC